MTYANPKSLKKRPFAPAEVPVTRENHAKRVRITRQLNISRAI